MCVQNDAGLVIQLLAREISINELRVCTWYCAALRSIVFCRNLSL
jgi:hypothetical protein